MPATLEDVQCYRCDQPAVQECPRCGNLYCDDHGDALCERCMDPASALPSYRVYRGSLVALLVGSIFAVWLLVRPGGEADADGPPAALAAVLPTSTPTPRPQTTATPQRTPSPTPTETAALGTPAPATPTPPPPTPTATPAAQTHTVASGDTLTSIAERYKPANVGIGDYLLRIYQLNNMTEFSTLSIGNVIRIPPG